MAEAKTDKAQEEAKAEAGVASDSANAKLKHTAVLEGGEEDAVTTRDDTHDLGVPMVQGSPDEPQGPEDAFGPGPKRGDYRNRGDGQEHFTMEANPNAGKPITRTDTDADGNEVEVVVDYEPNSIAVAQTPRTENIGDVPGVKGGVETTEDDKAKSRR